MHNNLNGLSLSGPSALRKADGREPLGEPTFDDIAAIAEQRDFEDRVRSDEAVRERDAYLAWVPRHGICGAGSPGRSISSGTSRMAPKGARGGLCTSCRKTQIAAYVERHTVRPVLLAGRTNSQARRRAPAAAPASPARTGACSSQRPDAIPPGPLRPGPPTRTCPRAHRAPPRD